MTVILADAVRSHVELLDAIKAISVSWDDIPVDLDILDRLHKNSAHKQMPLCKES